MSKKAEYGVSFSLHRCSELGLDKKKVLKSALEDLGFRRFRLMSYWNIHEQKQGKYDFRELDWQLDMIAGYGGQVSLCLGKRQPRWPECHMPQWAKELPREKWYEALFQYIAIVVERYKNHPALVSWQLENEALLKEFGYCEDKDYSHRRLRHELSIIRNLDRQHPVIMTLSDSWGLPWRSPRPDMYAMSLYRITINKEGKYTHSKRPALFYRLRAVLIRLLTGRRTFIHELQAEPWLKQSLTKSSLQTQLEYMNSDIVKETAQFADRTGMRPIDFWGLEWWYWLKFSKKDGEMWDAIQSIVKRV